ncbi:MAG: efflux RND transporter periplasmic adaptor subunit [Sphingomonas sp.]
MIPRPRHTAPLILLPLAGLALLTGCSGGKPKRDQGPPEVGYVVAQPTSAPITTELAGRTAAFQEAQVRPQVTGIVRKRFFAEGSIVHQGQTLYQIDPSLYRAAADQAAANLASATASAEAARAKADRYKPLAEIEAVAKQDYTDALAQARQSAASVAQSRAALATARINLRYTTVPAPITGRIGRSLFTEGALVSANQADPLATIQRLDPIYVDIQQSSTDLLALRRALASGGAVPGSAAVHLKLEDGSDYPLAGTVEFSEVVVDPATGSVTLRARFPNPQGLLLPGMFVRAVFAQAITKRAFLVPQQGLSRDAKGNASVLVLDRSNKLVQRAVTADRTQGAFWIVTQGLNAGDKIVTEGLLRAHAGQSVKAVPAGTPARAAAPRQHR